MNCEEGAVWMLDEQSGNLVAVSSAGPVNYCGMSANAAQGVLGKALREKKPFRMESLENGIPLLSEEDTTGQPAFVPIARSGRATCWGKLCRNTMRA